MTGVRPASAAASELTKLTMRTDYCGTLRSADIGRSVTVCGWVARRREHGEHLAFVDLRDHTGVVQCVVDGAHDIRNEYVVSVTGTVTARPEDTANADLATGEVELTDATVTVLSAAAPPPFRPDDRTEADETLRIRHRYLAMRAERMQANLRRRAVVNSAIRNAMAERDFVEVETPMLVASTPEGARDFVVPSRLHPTNFYALPQSPQLFKQLTMVGGLDRYYQIARCLRDEDLRADRQFEFSQLDLEMSFADGEAVRACVTATVAAATEAITGEAAPAFTQMTWHEAMDRYGTDKPDLRFGMELIDVTSVFADTEFNAFKTPCVKAMRVVGGGDASRNAVDALTEDAKRLGAKGLVWMRVERDTDGSSGGLGVNSPVAKFCSDAEIAGLLTALDAQEGDMCYLVADEWRNASEVLGQLRLQLGRPPVNEGGLAFVWVVDFPLFENVDADGHAVLAHHPFTRPVDDDLGLITAAAAAARAGEPMGADLIDVRSQAYDLVLNGWELGSGSVRINESDLQQEVFDVMGLSPDEAQRRFGFLLDAFRYGAPPHAGFAVGLDRLTALLCGEENIREVIAFPKTQSGADPLTEAPGPLSERHLEELGLAVIATEEAS